MQTTVTISIGRNVGDQPMSADKWRRFRADIGRRLRAAGANVFVDTAVSTGTWDGVREQSATWVASVEANRLETIRVGLERACRLFQQDAIALTIGQTELLHGEALDPGDDVACVICDKPIANVRGTLWHVGDPFGQFSDHSAQDHLAEKPRS